MYKTNLAKFYVLLCFLLTLSYSFSAESIEEIRRKMREEQSAHEARISAFQSMLKQKKDQTSKHLEASNNFLKEIEEAKTMLIDEAKEQFDKTESIYTQSLEKLERIKDKQTLMSIAEKMRFKHLLDQIKMGNIAKEQILNELEAFNY